MTKLTLCLLPILGVLPACGDADIEPAEPIAPSVAGSEPSELGADALAEFVQSCADEFNQSIAGQAFSGEQAAAFCQCSADKAIERGLAPTDMIDPAQMIPLGEECAAEVLVPAG